MVDNIEQDLAFCQRSGIGTHIAHLLHLQLRGLCVANYRDTTFGKDRGAYGEIHLRFPHSVLNGTSAVPRKLPVVPEQQSPYLFKEERILYRDQEIFERGAVVPVPLPERNQPRYLKGYSFPFIGTANPFYELRINPKNSGRCPGRCAFCHRGASRRLTPARHVSIISPAEIVGSIVRTHGSEALRQVAHVSVITELFGSEDLFLSYLDELKAALLQHGCKKEFSFRACSQDVRSEDGLRRLHSIIDGDRYSFTLEVFSDRRRIMGGYKGISLDEVERILTASKRIGFRDVKLNYIAGIDSLECFQAGVQRFRRAGVFDSIGLSILTAFFSDQLRLRNADAWSLSYYVELLKSLNAAGVALYEPACFEMGYPVQFLQRELPWMLAVGQKGPGRVENGPF